MRIYGAVALYLNLTTDRVCKAFGWCTLEAVLLHIYGTVALYLNLTSGL